MSELDPQAEESPAVELAAYLREVPGPVTLKHLQQVARRRWKWSNEKTVEALSQAVSAGGAFSWKTRATVGYWHSAAEAVIRERLLRLAEVQALAGPALAAQASRQKPACSRDFAEGVLKTVLREGSIKSASVLGQSRLLYSAQHPAALVKAAFIGLQAKLTKLGFDWQTFAVTPDLEAPPPETAASPDSEILDAMRRLQQAPGIPVTAHELRNALPHLSKADLDRAVLNLADREKVHLIAHNQGWALEEAQRNQLIHDGGRSLYVAITLRH